MAIDLKRFTPARVALGRAGHGLPTTEMLRLQLDHARARDAVYRELEPASLGVPYVLVRSAAADRKTYLQRPDLGRRLGAGVELMKGDYDAALVMVDGLSAPAMHHHAVPFWRALSDRLTEWRLAPLTVVLQGRVAIGDEIGERLGARLVVVMIGERPGLSAADSLGIYLTWNPRVGRTDAERNCISNVRTEGVSYDGAAARVYFLMSEARRRRLSGVALKEDGRLLE